MAEAGEKENSDDENNGVDIVMILWWWGKWTGTAFEWTVSNDYGQDDNKSDNNDGNEHR